jgi:hypothetical protein
MSTPFPYETRLNILKQPLELIDVREIADACEFKWYNQTLCKVNESVVRMAVIEGEYHWHKHDNDDEFFYVVEGELLIDLEDRTWRWRHGRDSWFRKGRRTGRGQRAVP